jgi:hypothetical protein
MRRGLLAAGAAAVALIYAGRLGLRVRPSPFPSFGGRQPAWETRPLPPGLPPPVERFYRRLYGESVPVIRSAVITGSARMRLGGISFPGRFRFTHDAGRGYRHYIEATFFGLPLLKVNETYLGGEARLDLPFGVIEGEPKVDQGANLALWAETAFWLPAVLVADPRVRWEEKDDSTALLVVPYGEAEERFVARFDGETGMLCLLEAQRYKSSTSGTKTGWRCEAGEWAVLGGHTVSSVGALTWADEGRPWAIFRAEEVTYNADVGGYIRARGI